MAWYRKLSDRPRKAPFFQTAERHAKARSVQAEVSGKEEAKETAQAEAFSVHGTSCLRISSVLTSFLLPGPTADNSSAGSRIPMPRRCPAIQHRSRETDQPAVALRGS